MRKSPEESSAARFGFHDAMGPGMLESVYEKCLSIELRDAHLHVENGRRVQLTYRGQEVDSAFIPDLIVEGTVVVEVKTVERFVAVHVSQVVTYLRLTGCPIGLLLNFHAASMRGGLKRVVRPDLFRAKHDRVSF
jgi:GxxExxY protein